MYSKTEVGAMTYQSPPVGNSYSYLPPVAIPAGATGYKGERTSSYTSFFAWHQNFGSLELYRGGQHRQHAAMVVMAMLGFYFELARHDRDEYVRVHLRHVRADKLHHFEKIRSDATFPLPYDYESATHPAWQFWRKVGISGISCVATFKTMDPDGTVMKSLGQHEKLLSDIDIIKINSVYGTKCFTKTRSGKSGKKKHHSTVEEENNDSETT